MVADEEGDDEMISAIHDLINMPDFNWDTQKGRGDWSTRDVSNGDVTLDTVWGKPQCVEHGAMNAVTPDRSIWRCLCCGRACYANHKTETKCQWCGTTEHTSVAHDDAQF